MGQQAVLHLRPADVVAGGDDHVVGARLVKKIAVGIHQVGVAGDVPAMADIGGLARIVQIAAAGGAFHRQSPHAARRQGLAVRVKDAGAITGDRLAGGAGANFVLGMRNEDVQHFSGADTVDDANAGGLLP